MLDPTANVTPQTGFKDAFTRVDGVPALPIVVGVVGHRKFRSDDDKRVLKEALRKLFGEFQSAYSSSPLLVVTSLAEGADQLAAEAALEIGVFVRAPLPFVCDAYKTSTSFVAHEAREYLDKLVNREARVESFVVPLPKGFVDPATDWQAVAKAPAGDPMADLRKACYANAGGHLTRRCHVLVALWNGEPAAGDSGTAEYTSPIQDRG